jgi:hypothetical protein
MEDSVDSVVQEIAGEIVNRLDLRPSTPITNLKTLDHLFERSVLRKPLILIIDEFDALSEAAIGGLAGVFRNIYNRRRDQANLPSRERDYLLHGVALIGVRSVLGIESQRGSPFNVQRSLRIPNLTCAEVESMFKWYEQESEQTVEQAVIERVFYETQGQPGLVGWLGELLTETYNEDATRPITLERFERMYSAALDLLPNSNVVNLISKARQSPYKELVLELFQTGRKVRFRYDDQQLNFLYMNGVIDVEVAEDNRYYVRFSSPFVQKRLFNYFAFDIFPDVGRLYRPFENLDDTITATSLDVRRLLRRYEQYLKENRNWLLRNVPRRSDLRPYEAVYHFNFYAYLEQFFQYRGGQVLAEFPTGNGKVDILIRYAGQVYGLELKSFEDNIQYNQAIAQAAQYGQQLGLAAVTLVFFVEEIDEANRQKYEVEIVDPATDVTVDVVFVSVMEGEGL